jgi:hypothetical protein
VAAPPVALAGLAAVRDNTNHGLGLFQKHKCPKMIYFPEFPYTATTT